MATKPKKSSIRCSKYTAADISVSNTITCTNVSQKQTYQLIQILLNANKVDEKRQEQQQQQHDAANENNGHKNDSAILPKSIKDALNIVMNAQKFLVNEVEKQLHKGFHECAKDTVRQIVTTCPEFLSVEKDIGYANGGALLVSNAIYSHHNNLSIYVPMFAKVGYRNNVGGCNKTCRGGLLIKSKRNPEINVFERLSSLINFKSEDEKLDVVQTFKNLAVMKLFKKKDIKTYDLLHIVAAAGENKPLASYFISLDPTLLHTQALDLLPIHYCCDSQNIQMFQVILDAGITHFRKKKDTNHKSSPLNFKIGGLFQKDNNNRTAFHLAVAKFGEQSTWNCIENSLLSHYADEMPILHEAIPIFAPSSQNQNSKHPRNRVDELNYLGGFFLRFPESLYVRDTSQKDRLPIHVALEHGLEWSHELLSCMHANKEALSEEDPVTKLNLFALAASGPNSCCLRVIYRLLRSHPENLMMRDTNTSIHEKSPNCETNAEKEVIVTVIKRQEEKVKDDLLLNDSVRSTLSAISTSSSIPSSTIASKNIDNNSSSSSLESGEGAWEEWDNDNLYDDEEKVEEKVERINEKQHHHTSSFPVNDTNPGQQLHRKKTIKKHLKAEISIIRPLQMLKNKRNHSSSI